MASVLGSVACLSSLLLLWACLESGHKGSLFRRMHLPPIPYAKIITMLYLKVTVYSLKFAHLFHLKQATWISRYAQRV